ncbi:replication factor C large subunit [Candidatus Woesearchaeota archaeon]|nr:MAG: replication factor C large subunit [Candidatus Woesearchaeota archaeon]
MCLWTEKYVPKDVSEVQGQNTAMEVLKSYVVNYKSGAILLYGPTGCGKTCSVYALARSLNSEILELNASDLRNKEKMVNVVGASSKQMSLFSKGKIILIDEIDALSGMKDRGCLQALSKIIKESSWPIVVIADNPWDKKLADLRKKCKLVEFKTLSYLSVAKVLKKICLNENVDYDQAVLNSLARKNGGDVRAAINDLQVLTILNKKLDKYDGIVDDRLQKSNVIDALRIVLKSKTPENVINAFDNLDMDHNEIMLWIDENLPKEYTANDLVKAYEVLSRADVFNGRIRRWQYWRYMVYIYNLLTVGVALAKEERNKAYVPYKSTTRILKLWQAKMKYAKRNSIAEKIAAKTKVSKAKALRDVLPYLKIIINNSKEVANDLELTEDEIKFIMGS